MFANALALVGDLDGARRLANLDDNDTGSLSVRSYSNLTLGLIAWRRGQIESARNYLHASVRLAHESKDLWRIGWSHLYLFRFMIDTYPIDVVLAALPEVRRIVTRVGLPHVTAYLHISVSVLEGQIGRLDEALRHCELAESLSGLTPNSWLLGGALLNKSCIACLGCDFRAALEYVHAAKKFSARSGHAGLANAIDSTLGQIELLTGQFERAEQTSRRVLSRPDAAMFAKIAASDILSRVYLALGRLDDCESALRFVDDATHACGGGINNVYHVRWAGITKARFLLKGGFSDQALKWLSELAVIDPEGRDVPFNITLDLVAAQALARAGSSDRAAQRLLNAC